jgi:alpha-beta hydrolase superfamily lysophospholipase
MAATSEADVLGAPYRRETIDLGHDGEGVVVATLVHRHPVAKSRPALLHVHGFCDYFFQTDYAESWVDSGWDFYALDLRKHGRSLLPHQTPNYTEDLTVYFAELDEAFARITERDGHRTVVISGHSTGGLIVALWVARHHPEIAGMVLNSPFLELGGPAPLRTGLGWALELSGSRFPDWVIPRPVNGLYGQSLHVDHGGEWSFDTDWKPLGSFPVSVGWLRAVHRAQAEAHSGLGITVPILVLTSERSSFPHEWEPDVDRTDIVLDAVRLRRWSPALGTCVTSVAIQDALHDVTLSRPEVRAQVKEEITRWLSAYVPVRARPSRRTQPSR